MCKLPPEIQESVEKEEEHQGQPKDTLSFPCLHALYQNITPYKDSRTACLGRFIYCLILRVLMVIILCNPSFLWFLSDVDYCTGYPPLIVCITAS